MELSAKILAVYPQEYHPEKPRIKASLHAQISIAGLEFDLKNVLFYRDGDFWRIQLPSRRGVKDGLSCEFPIFSFSDRELNKRLIAELRAKAIIAVSEYFQNNPAPIEAPKKAEAKIQASPKAAAPKRPETKLGDVTRIQTKTWSDPPMRKPSALLERKRGSIE